MRVFYLRQPYSLSAKCAYGAAILYSFDAISTQDLGD